ncbi:hypothetical protein GC177_01070 [bacterium]|nr:hypothetical protein [bacterium]
MQDGDIIKRCARNDWELVISNDGARDSFFHIEESVLNSEDVDALCATDQTVLLLNNGRFELRALAGSELEKAIRARMIMSFQEYDLAFTDFMDSIAPILSQAWLTLMPPDIDPTKQTLAELVSKKAFPSDLLSENEWALLAGAHYAGLWKKIDEKTFEPWSFRRENARAVLLESPELWVPAHLRQLPDDNVVGTIGNDLAREVANQILVA